MGRRGRPGERRTENGEQSAPTGRRINRRSVRRAFIVRSCISCISCWSSWGVLMARRRRAGGAGESGSLEAWMLGSLAFSLYNYFACRPLVGRSVLRGRGRFGPLGLHALFSVLQGAKAPFPCRGVGQCPTAKLPSLQTSKLPVERPAGGSRPLIGSNRRNRRFLLRVPSWFFVFLAVEGLALWACTVIAAQRSASSPPKAAARASTSVAPPSLQASKLPSSVLRALRVLPKTFHFLPLASPVARLPRALFSVLCSLFSVLCSLFSVL